MHKPLNVIPDSGSAAIDMAIEELKTMVRRRLGEEHVAFDVDPVPCQDDDEETLELVVLTVTPLAALDLEGGDELLESLLDWLADHPDLSVRERLNVTIK